MQEWVCFPDRFFCFPFNLKQNVMHFDLEQARTWLQTIIPAVAFGGAVLVAVWQQKRLDDRVREERARKHLASRVTLPISLAKLNRYAEECASFLRFSFPDEGSTTLHGERVILPSFPHDVISNLKECIESGDRHINDALAGLIRFCQIQNSRMVGSFNRFATDNYVSDRVYGDVAIDVLRLWAMVEKFYKYGRLESCRVEAEVSLEDIESAARVLALDRIQAFATYLASVRQAELQ